MLFRNRIEELFLRTEDLRLLELTEYLNAKDDWVPAKVIADHLECSTQTVYIYVEKLEQLIEHEKWPLEVEVFKSKGVRLRAENVFYIGTVRQTLIKSAVIFKFFSACFHETYHNSLTAFADENYVSVPSINSYLTEFQDKIEPYGVKVDRVNFKLIGDENDIRHFAVIIYWGCSIGIEWPFVGVTRDSLMSYIEEYQQIFDIEYHNVAREKLLQRLAIVRIRTNKKHFITDSTKLDELVHDHPYYHKVAEVHRDFFSMLSGENRQLESMYLFALFQTFPFFEDNSSYVNANILFHRMNNTASWQMTNRFVEGFVETYPMEEHLIRTSGVLGYLLFLQTRLLMYPAVQPNYHSKEFAILQKDYPLFMKNISGIVEKMYVAQGESVPSNKTAFFLQRVAHLLTAVASMRKYEPRVYVLVLSQDNQIFENSYEVILAQSFNYNFFFLDKLEKHHEYDLIISDSYYPEVEDAKKLIYWSPAYDNATWKQLDNKLAAVRDAKLEG